MFSGFGPLVFPFFGPGKPQPHNNISKMTPGQEKELLGLTLVQSLEPCHAWPFTYWGLVGNKGVYITYGHATAGLPPPPSPMGMVAAYLRGSKSEGNDNPLSGCNYNHPHPPTVVLWPVVCAL